MMRMQVLSRSIRHHGLSLPSPSPPLSFTTSAPPHRWPPALARRDMAASNPLARRVSRFPYASRNTASSSGVKGEVLGKPARRPLIPPAKERILSLGGRPATATDRDAENSSKTKDFIARYGCGHPAAYGEGIQRTGVDAIDSKLDEWGKKPKEVTKNVDPMDVIPNSSHGDGSIYRGDDAWKEDFRVADRGETRVEAMMLSNPTDCSIHDGTCLTHSGRSVLQIFSLSLAKVVYGGPVELYGYIAARDGLDPLLNYVVNFNRDDPIIVEQGSLINMTGPKRGIELYETIILEYDMRIKTGKLGKDDLQLIDGVSIIDDIGTLSHHLITNRIHGDCGAVDVTIARFDYGVEATVEVVFEVQSSFNLCLGCFSSRLDKEIRLFDGTIVETCGLRRSVVAVDKNSWMDLKFTIARLEAMMLSNPTNCNIHDGTCFTHTAGSMLQIFSLNLARVDGYGGPVELYGYIAARDVLDPLLNYVVNFSRDDPIIVEQGSLISMTGPKRGIELYETIILEYDMRIKIGKLEKDDLQLIDGVSIIDDIDTLSHHLITNRIHGDCGAVDITIARFDCGVEATVEVVFEVQNSFSLCLGCFSSRLDKEIRLFDGTIIETCVLRRSVIAVDEDSWMDLKFKIGSGSQFYSEHYCSFKAYVHGHENQLIKTVHQSQ